MARTISPEDERWAKFVTEGDPDECWEWAGGCNWQGYGRFYLSRPEYRKSVSAHRVALIRAGIEIPPGMMALHRCDNPPCVNPAHLYVGNRSQNALDFYRRGGAHNIGPGEKHPWAKFSDAEVDSWRTRCGVRGIV